MPNGFPIYPMNYSQYLRSEHWRGLRGVKLQLAPRCERCKSKEEIEVHHLVYRASWFDARLTDLETLCRTCHLAEHAKAWKRIKPADPLPPKQHEFRRGQMFTPVEALERGIARLVRAGRGGTKQVSKLRERLAKFQRRGK